MAGSPTLGSMVTKFRGRAVTAAQFTGENAAEVIEAVATEAPDALIEEVSFDDGPDWVVVWPAGHKEGDPSGTRAWPGRWLVARDGEVEGLSDDEFRARYEAA